MWLAVRECKSSGLPPGRPTRSSNEVRSHRGAELRFTRGDPVVPARASSSERLVSTVMFGPVTLNLKLPHSRRRWSGLTASLVLHGVVLGWLVTYGERLWSRTPAPGNPGWFGGNPSISGSGGNRVAYITLP